MRWNNVGEVQWGSMSAGCFGGKQKFGWDWLLLLLSLLKHNDAGLLITEVLEGSHLVGNESPSETGNITTHKRKGERPEALHLANPVLGRGKRRKFSCWNWQRGTLHGFSLIHHLLNETHTDARSQRWKMVEEVSGSEVWLFAETKRWFPYILQWLSYPLF